MDKDRMKSYRSFLKDSIRKTIDFSQTDQNRGIAPPPVEKPYAKEGKRIDLLKWDEWGDIGKMDLKTAIKNRESRRSYSDKSLSLKELSFLLWATQGIRENLGPGHARRTVPSAGCRHALETYLFVFNVETLEPGIYRYLPVEHQLLFEFAEDHLDKKLIEATFGQSFAGESAVTFVWTAIPYRMEWRYDIDSHKVIAIEAGHVCQNLYLAGEAIDAGICAIAAYDQEKMDALLRVDGADEISVYIACVGKN
ncbi:MAG: SagB/ThcOx family dehydrogenase [Desulfobacteraceae bacterium]|nr:MAG: SagB/ThcOx family dehydrogenase [Desulfobacteraceae bacterium]